MSRNYNHYQKKKKPRKNRKKQKKDRAKAYMLLILGIAGIIAVLTVGYKVLFATGTNGAKTVFHNLKKGEEWEGAPPLDVQLLTVNEYSRPGTPLKKIKGVVIHYTANPGTSAQANRNYFENLKDTHTTKASSHFIVGLEGEIVQCIPSKEIAYASNERNEDTLSIECCHPDESGQFTAETYQSVVELTAWLCKRFNLTSDDVIRHYDVTKKLCPKYYVEHEDAWEQLKADVQKKIETL